jgi:hypothetical protein
MIITNLDLLNNKENWVDCFRQWFILLMTLLLVIYLQAAIKVMQKAQGTVDIDQVILFIELVKVSPVLLIASRQSCSV